MPTRNDLLKARLATVRRDLDDLIPNIKDELLAWAPVDGMRTIGGQLVEIVATEMQLIALAQTDRAVSDDEAAAVIGDTDKADVLLDALQRVREETRLYLDSLSEEDLNEEIEFGGGWFGSLGFDTIPRAEIFLNIADHEWYHVGQLTSYLWARGVNPYE